MLFELNLNLSVSPLDMNKTNHSMDSWGLFIIDKRLGVGVNMFWTEREKA